jgi:hypothetical protein
VLAVLAGLLLAFACAVMAAVMIDIGDSPRCDDRAELREELAESGPDAECFEGSQAQKTISLILGWPSAVGGGLAFVLSIAFAITGRRGRPVALVAVAAMALGALSIVIGSV